MIRLFILTYMKRVIRESYSHMGMFIGKLHGAI